MAARTGTERAAGRRARRRAGLVALLLAFAANAPAAPSLRIGLGAAPLPTPEGGPLAGYGGLRDREARGVLDVPEAHALVLDRAGLRVALLVLDLVIVRPEQRARIQARASGLDLDLLAAVATHTHSGPGGYIPGWVAGRLTAGGYRPEAAPAIEDAALAALAAAVADLAPARVASGVGALPLARNRRFADGARETALPLLRVDFDDGREPALLFAYGMHPTVLPSASRRYSADYPGAARRWLRERGWRAVFLPGPLGDQGPGGDPDALPDERLEEIGARVGEAVLEAARALPAGRDAELFALERWVDVPEPRTPRFCALWWLAPLVGPSLDAFFSERVPLQAVRLGAAEWVLLPAEPAAAVGAAIRQPAEPGRALFVIAHANDWLGYAVTRETWERKSYETCMSFHGPDWGEWLIGEAALTRALLAERARGAAGGR